MDTRTRELYNLDAMSEKERAELLKNPDVRKVPEGELALEAASLLAAGERFAPRGSNLDIWAKQKRKGKKNRKRNKMARSSRKRNRK